MCVGHQASLSSPSRAWQIAPRPLAAFARPDIAGGRVAATQHGVDGVEVLLREPGAAGASYYPGRSRDGERKNKLREKLEREGTEKDSARAPLCFL